MQTQQDTVEVGNSANQAYSQQAWQSSEAATQGYCAAPYIRPGTQCPHSSMLHHTIFSLSLSLLTGFLLLFIPQSWQCESRLFCFFFSVFPCLYHFKRTSGIRQAKQRVSLTQCELEYDWIPNFSCLWCGAAAGWTCHQGREHHGSIWYTWTFLRACCCPPPHHRLSKACLHNLY